MGDATVKKYFGVSVDEVLSRPGETVIPSFLKSLIQTMNSEDVLKEEGIFRIACRDPDMQQLKRSVDTGVRVNWSEHRGQPHLLAGVMRLYLRELPIPLVPDSLIPEFLRAAESPDAAARVAQFRRVVSRVPPLRRQFMEVLLLFFARVTEFEQFNKMTASNLAVIFNQVFFRHAVETLETMLEMPKYISVVRILIETVDDLLVAEAAPNSARPAGATEVLSARSVLQSSTRSPALTSAAPAGAGASSTDSAALLSPRGATATDRAAAQKARIALPVRPEGVNDRAVLLIEDTVQALGRALRELQQRLDSTDSLEEALDLADRISAASAILRRETASLTPHGAGGSSSSGGGGGSGSNEASLGLSIAAGFDGQKGRRVKMEDAEILLLDAAAAVGADVVLPASSHPIAFFGVYDGHGGELVARYAAEHLHLAVLRDAHFAAGEIEAAMAESFHATDKKIIELGIRGGTTVVVVIVVDRVLYVGNLGDSEAVLARRGDDGAVAAVCLTNKHSPANKDESDRIRAAGGRVIFGRVFGDIAVARSLGDAMYKVPETEKDLLSSEPSTSRVPLTSRDQFVILACDGVWDVFSYQDAVQFVRTRLDEGHGPESCAKLLVAAALENGSLDNCTCMISVFDFS